MCRSASNFGWTQTGSTPPTMTAAITDLCALRDSSSFSPGPATDSMAVLTERAAAGGEERLVGADRVRHQVLRTAQHALGLTAVVQSVQGEDVGAEHVEADDLGHPRIRPAALLVPRRAVCDVSPAAEVPQRLQHGYPRMIHGSSQPSPQQRRTSWTTACLSDGCTTSGR